MASCQYIQKSNNSNIVYLKNNLLLTVKREDSLWKAILEDLFDDFLRFFISDANDIFDMERGFEFLDK